MDGALGFALNVTGQVPEEGQLMDRVKEAVHRGTRRVNIINGFAVNTDSSVRLLTGPVVGEVTSDSAIVLIEVTGAPEAKVIPIAAAVYKDLDQSTPVDTVSKDATPKRPLVFKFSGLEPETDYTVVLNGVCKFNATHKMVKFHTKAEWPTNFRMLALSCDRPSRLLLGQQDPWQHMLRRCNNVDAVLHVGDQIYPDNEDIAHADNIFNEIFDGLTEQRKHSMMLRGRELWRNKYRNVFSREGKVDLMAKVSNLMVWSDNDVANDFTTMMNADGSQKYHPNFLQCGMRSYREYQRRLWDPDCHLTLSEGEDVREWHAHHYGGIGIFMFDLRGNRIDSQGKTTPDNTLLSEAQWEDVEAFFQREGMRVAILCSETPFVGDEPAVCKAKVEEDPNMDFLRDHWPYNEDELIRLLDLCFNFKAEGERSGIGREVLLIGGDIHCGVTSVVRDDETGLQIDQLTASPVTNHVCKFFPPPQGNVSPRYNFSHLPLGRKFRNYADVSVTIGAEDVFVQAKLVPVSTDIFKDNTWEVEDYVQEEEE